MSPAERVPMTAIERRILQEPSTSEWWIRCDQWHEHYGEHGAAGLLLIHGPQMHILLQHRPAWVDHPLTWGIPSGALHAHEDPRVGALREAREEGVGSFDYAAKMRMFTSDHGGWAFHTVVANVQSKPVTRFTREATQWRWVRAVDLVNSSLGLPLHPGFQTFIDEHERDL